MSLPNARCRGSSHAQSRAQNDAGFTLLELIVAAAILALIAVFSWRGLDQLLRERDAIATSQDAIDVMQRSFARLERDAMLARDAQLDGSGLLRLVSGNAAVDYRYSNGAFTRTIAGAENSSAMTLQTGIAKLVIEAWSAGGKGWSPIKGLATEPLAPPPQRPQAAGAVVAATNPNDATAAANNSVSNNTSNAPAADANANANVNANANANVNTNAGPLNATGLRLVAVATGIRLSIARSDGTEVVRVFLIGSGG